MILPGCLTQDNLSEDTTNDSKTEKKVNPIYKELIDISDFLRAIDKEADNYKEKSNEPRVLKVTEKKFNLLKMLEEDQKFKDQWDETYLDYDQKPRYLRINDKSFLNFEGGQCVDAIYSLTNHKVPISAWIKGEQVVKADIEPGTVIATFNEKGQYYGHAAVFKSKNDNYIEVFDQNWWSTDKTGKIIEWTKNIFCTHRIVGNTGIYSPNNINNYYIVMVK